MRLWILTPLFLVGCLDPVEGPQTTFPGNDTGVVADVNVSDAAADSGASDAHVDTSPPDQGQVDAGPDTNPADTGPDAEQDAEPDVPAGTFVVRRRPVMEALTTHTFETTPNLDDVVWTSSNPEILSFVGDLATAHKPGNVTVTATHNGVSAEEDVTVFWQLDEVTVGTKNYGGAGDAFVCVATSTGRTFCWGDNAFGQALKAPTSGDVSAWSSEYQSGRFTRLEAGDDFVCGVAPGDGSRVRCWGNNDTRQLGNGGTTETHTPTFVSLDTSLAYDDLECRRFSCCTRSASDLHCWGDGFNPGTVPGMETPAALAKGGDHVCILKNGEVLCLGDGQEGQLGNGYPDTSTSPLTVKNIQGVIDIWAGDDHNCAKVPALVVGGWELRCWGENSYKQIGLAIGSSDDDPNLVYMPSTFANVFLGSDSSCGLDAAGNAFCWGANLHGGLGIGLQVESTSIPTALDTTVKFKKLDIGGYTTCGISVDGELYCWGANTPAIVPGAGDELYSPVRVPNPWEIPAP